MPLQMPPLPPPLWAHEGRHYRVHMPKDVTVVAACEEVGCDQWRNGWETVCEEASDPAHATVAMLIRAGKTGRAFTEMHDVRNGVIVTIFRFDSGQRCFTEHRTRPGRLLVMRRGRVLREHTSLADLAEDYTEHAGRLAGQAERG